MILIIIDINNIFLLVKDKYNFKLINELKLFRINYYKCFIEFKYNRIFFWKEELIYLYFY